MNKEAIEKQIILLEREMRQLEASEEYEALVDLLEKIDELERERDSLEVPSEIEDSST